jgi:hypothetical protein
MVSHLESESRPARLQKKNRVRLTLYEHEVEAEGLEVKATHLGWD